MPEFTSTPKHNCDQLNIFRKMLHIIYRPANFEKVASFWHNIRFPFFCLGISRMHARHTLNRVANVVADHNDLLT